MSSTLRQPRSNNPNAPNLPPGLYLEEKSNFAGTFISSMLYGIAIVLFFQCMAALFNPVYRRGERIKWGLVSYTIAMFSLVTVQTALNLDTQSISYIDNRAFSDIKGLIEPGPLGYQVSIITDALAIVPDVMFALSTWLADGLLLYRCYFIYSKNVWVIAFPCLMYLGSVAMSIVLTYQATQLTTFEWAGIPYFSLSLSLNIILTLMIVVRLTLHIRGVRAVMGGTGSGGLCKAIVTMFIESFAINAVTSVLVLGVISTGNGSLLLFIAILPETQVIAQLFIVHRIANKSAFTSKSIASARMSTFKARSRGETTDGGPAVPDGDLADSVDEREMNSSEPGAGVETGNDSSREEVY